MRSVVAAVNIAAGEIDYHIGSIKGARPISEVVAIPMNRWPIAGLNVPCDDGDFMTLLMEVAGEQMANLATTSRNNDA
jgi:hypothetical protein